MVEYIKEIFGFGSAKKIPEIILIKNEPKHYYDSLLSKWVFEGEEDYIRDKKENFIPPSKMKSENIHNKAKIIDKNDTSTRYKNILPQDNIIQSSQNFIRNIGNDDMNKCVQRINEKDAIIAKLTKEINEFNDLIEITEDKCNESLKYYKEELNKYLKDNISHQETISSLNQEIQLKENEINQYKIIIVQYQELIKEEPKPVESLRYSNNDYQKLLIEDNDQSFTANKERTDLILNSKMEKIKGENMFLLNDIKKLQTDNLNYKSITESMNQELVVLKEDLQFKDKHIGLLEKKISDSKSNSFENNGLWIKMNKLTGENIVLKSQIEKLKVKLAKTKSQLDNSQMDYKEMVTLKRELLSKKIKLTDFETEMINIWSFIEKECNQIKRDDIFHNSIAGEPNMANLLALLKYLFTAIIQSKNEIGLLNERESYLKEENDNYQLEIQILKDHLKESSIELMNQKEEFSNLSKINRDLNSKIKEMMKILTQTKNEYEIEKENKIKLENEIKSLKQMNNSSDQSDSIMNNNTLHKNNTFSQTHININNKTKIKKK